MDSQQLEVLRDRGVLFDRPGDPATESFRMLRTQVLFWLTDRRQSTIGITSPTSSEGKTTTAINLAVQIAAEVDCSVLLVDANLRVPGVHHALGWEPMPGLSDYLTGDVPVERLLVQPGIDRLLVLPAGNARPDSAELLGSGKMAALVHDLKTRFPQRIMVFDLPSVLEATDALALSRHLDGLLLVARQGSTHKRDLARAQALLPADKLVGVALNASAAPAKQSGAGWFRRR